MHMMPSKVWCRSEFGGTGQALLPQTGRGAVGLNVPYCELFGGRSKYRGRATINVQTGINIGTIAIRS